MDCDSINKLKAKVKYVLFKCNEGVNFIKINNLFGIDTTKLSSFKIGIEVHADGGIWWSAEEKQDYYNPITQLHANCTFFSSDVHGWTIPDFKALDSYFAFNFESLVIRIKTEATLRIFLLYKI